MAKIRILATEYDPIHEEKLRMALPELGHQFYCAVADFQSKYIAHMAMEEGEINPLLWANFTDEELMGQHAKIMTTLSPDQIMMWFNNIVPALNPLERSIIMGGFKANAPEEFFVAVFTMLKDHMSETDHTQLEVILTQPIVAN